MGVFGDWCVVTHNPRQLSNGFSRVDPGNHCGFDSANPVSELNELCYARILSYLTYMLHSTDPELHQSFSDIERDPNGISNIGHVRLGLLPPICHKVYLERRHIEIGKPTTASCKAKCFRCGDKAFMITGFTTSH